MLVKIWLIGSFNRREKALGNFINYCGGSFTWSSKGSRESLQWFSERKSWMESQESCRNFEPTPSLSTAKHPGMLLLHKPRVIVFSMKLLSWNSISKIVWIAVIFHQVNSFPRFDTNFIDFLKSYWKYPEDILPNRGKICKMTPIYHISCHFHFLASLCSKFPENREEAKNCLKNFSLEICLFHIWIGEN